MEYPRLNSNGSKKDELLGEYETAGRTIANAIQAVNKITVHGRDYLTAEDGAYERARQEQADRVNRLRTVYNELVTIYCNIDDQGR